MVYEVFILRYTSQVVGLALMLAAYYFTLPLLKSKTGITWNLFMIAAALLSTSVVADIAKDFLYHDILAVAEQLTTIGAAALVLTAMLKLNTMVMKHD